MKVEFVLVGPPMSGKTTILTVLRKKIPQQNEYYQTNGTQKKNYKKINKTLGIFGGTGFHDTGGNSSDVDKYAQWIKESKYVLLVFNGLNFLEEVKGTQGGEIGSLIRNVILPALKECNKSKDKHLFFIATYSDQYKGDMKADILKMMKESNETYKALVGVDRYPYLAAMKISHHFFCINAMSSADVSKTYNEINVAKER